MKMHQWMVNDASMVDQWYIKRSTNNASMVHQWRVDGPSTMLLWCITRFLRAAKNHRTMPMSKS